MKYNFSKEEEVEYVESFKNGTLIRALAQKFGCSYGTMRGFLVLKLGKDEYKKIAKEHKIETFRKGVKIFLKIEKTEIVEGYKNGENLGELAQKFGCSRGPIGKVLIEELGLENYKEIAKEHSERWGKLPATEKTKKACQKMGQAPKTKKQLEASSKNAQKTVQKWRKEHPKEQAERGRKALAKWREENPEEVLEACRKGGRNAAKVNPSLQEILFSVILANENVQFTDQFSIFYRDIINKKRVWFVDFFIFPNIIVQLDGVYWHCRKQGRLLSDWLQNQELKKLGYKVIRFWDFEINTDIDKCIKKLKNLTYLFC